MEKLCKFIKLLRYYKLEKDIHAFFISFYLSNQVYFNVAIVQNYILIFSKI
jgi:hypothetical protein